jgi:hypothetical protein
LPSSVALKSITEARGHLSRIVFTACSSAPRSEPRSIVVTMTSSPEWPAESAIWRAKPAACWRAAAAASFWPAFEAILERGEPLRTSSLAATGMVMLSSSRVISATSFWRASPLSDAGLLEAALHVRRGLECGLRWHACERDDAPDALGDGLLGNDREL